MTSFSIERLKLEVRDVSALVSRDKRATNWPVVYLLDDNRSVYVGESINFHARMRQHMESPEKQRLTSARVILDDTFNKSACLDLEARLISLFAGDGRFTMLNRNDGITDANYFDRGAYRETFDEVFDELRRQGMFAKSRREIENSDLFKLSPFKALNPDQEEAVTNIMYSLLRDLEGNRKSLTVVRGDPGTGKTIVGIYLLKLLRDVAAMSMTDDDASDTPFSGLFQKSYRDLLNDLRVGFVIPQQSLRASVEKVFKRTAGLEKMIVLSPFDVGKSTEPFDILVVDETHRLNHRANQSSGSLNASYAEINRSIFGVDDNTKTQLDWLIAKSAHLILLLDPYQSVRPADLPFTRQEELLKQARKERRLFELRTQMRMKAGEDYLGFVRRLLGGEVQSPLTSFDFGDYDFRLFDNLSEMRYEILARDQEVGLARLVAGFAWPWRSRNGKAEFDFTIDGEDLRWNSAEKDWINSTSAPREVGSIHTVQGYDLNYTGVIIGSDLRFDPIENRVFFDRSNYHDTKGKENNRQLGISYSDDDLLQYVVNIYSVLLTRGMLGTYVYVVDINLRDRLHQVVDALVNRL